MKKIEVTRQGIVTNRLILEDSECAAYIEVAKARNEFGQNEYVVSYRNEVTPATLDESGNTLTDAVYELVEETVPANYTLEVTDITTDYNQNKANQEALLYLASTDWYAVRFAETGTEIPDDIKIQRAAARTQIVR